MCTVFSIFYSVLSILFVNEQSGSRAAVAETPSRCDRLAADLKAFEVPSLTPDKPLKSPSFPRMNHSSHSLWCVCACLCCSCLLLHQTVPFRSACASSLSAMNAFIEVEKRIRRVTEFVVPVCPVRSSSPCAGPVLTTASTTTCSHRRNLPSIFRASNSSFHYISYLF